MSELVPLALEGREQEGISYRVYTPYIGPNNALALEIEFKSLAEYEKFWAEWSARPETAAFLEKWNQLTESGGSNEIWELEE